MRWTEYEQLAMRTKSDIATLDHVPVDVLHGAMGLSTEAGEMMDNVKRAVFYGKPLNLGNLQEEIGDVCWYIALICSTTGLDFNEILERNIDKLRIRYPERFASVDALNRKLVEEQAIFNAKENHGNGTL
jgi:NTP pyrophosphatase (non-canonical NTP hydrolase)